MDRFLALFPKNLLAFTAIAVGIVFIILNQPPHSLCDSQLEVLNEAQGKFLYKDPKSKAILTTEYERLRDHCKATNDPGGCYELFHELKILLHDLGMSTSECVPVIGRIKEVNRAMWESVEIIVRLAWGEVPPASYASKLGWLDAADISLYCQLKAGLIGVQGETVWESFREKMIRELPGAKDLPRNQIWDLSIFSENCARYP